MNELLNEKIEDMIYEIRGKQVMLDSDLARLYQCKNGTKSINLAVKRHVNRFPERFMFQLTKEEALKIYSRFQNETLNNKINLRGNNIKYLPYVFTEQGVAMLSSVLKTSVAETISIQIMDAFVMLRKYMSSELLDQQYIKNILLKHENKLMELDDSVLLLQKSFDKLESKELVNQIYFDGEIYDSYSKILDIMSKAKKEITIIDNYADKVVLDMIRRLKVSVTLITKNNSLLSKIDIEKYNKQYNNLIVKYNNTFHDRYIILDKAIVYHCGASINYIGYKTFSINKLQDKEVIDLLINKILRIN